MTPRTEPRLPFRVAHALLLVLAAALPFEVPLCRVGPLQLTTVEIVLYATLAAWGLGTALSVLRNPATARTLITTARESPLVAATLLWTAVLFASALAAPSYRAEAMKFALRTLSGVLVFFAARSLAATTQATRRVLHALLTGAIVSAATAVLESAAPSSAALWSVFHDHGFDTLGLRRASGVFGYPTIGAMYWEAAVPLSVVAPFAFADLAPLPGEATPSSRVARVAPVAGTLLLFLAIFASATRSSLAGAAIACVALLRVTRGWARPVSLAAGGALGALVITTAIALGAGSLLGQRLRFWHDDTWLRVEYAIAPTAQAVRSEALFTTAVTLRNTGTVTWRRSGEQPTRLAHHWYRTDSDRALLTFEGRRTELPEDVPPGGVVHVAALAQAPVAGGTYRLAWDLVQEDVAWFSEKGNPTPEESVVVRGAVESLAPEASAPTEVAHPPFTAPPPRRALWRAAVALWLSRPLLGVGPDGFRRRYEAILSPAPNGAPYTDTRIHANNLYFETLANLGAVGLGAVAALAFALARTLHRQVSTRNVLGLGLGVAAAMFFVHGVSDYFLEFTPAFGLFWMLLGLTDASRRGSARPPLVRAALPDSTP